MGDLATTCKDKLAYFRIKELKDVLIRLALPKHGKKQELVDRILALLAEDQGQWHFGWGKKNAPSKETVAGVVDDIYRKMQVHGPPELLLQRPVATDFSYLKRPKEQERPCQPDANKSHCVCGQTFLLGNVVKCEDCQVQQHTDCVLIPEKPTGRPEVPDHFYCQLCRLKRADPYLVTTGNLLLPVRLMFSNVANDGTNVSQCVDKTFLLSRAEREIVQRTEYDIQVWCMLLNDKVQFRMHWPQHAELHVNGILVRVVPRPSSQLLGNNGRDDGPVITTFCQEGQNKIVLSCTDARPFCIGVRIARKRTVEQNRENDELTRGLGNDEHKRRTQDTPGFKPWTIAFPQDRKKYPDKSHQKRKEREAREARVAADRLRNIEETVKRQQDQIDALIQQGTTSQSQRHKLEAELDATGPSSRKSSVASTELQAGDDDALTMAPLRYPVDDITERTPCELHVKVVNITIKVAVGYALRIGPKPTFHCSPVPHGYAVVWVDEVMKGFEELKLDQVMKGFEELKLDHPAGEDRYVTELGEAKKMTILWQKEFIVLPNWTPRPSTQSSNPFLPLSYPSAAQQSSSYSLPQAPSPAQPSLSPRQASPFTETQGQKRKRITATLSSGKSGNRSPKCRVEPPKSTKGSSHETLRPY